MDIRQSSRIILFALTLAAVTSACQRPSRSETADGDLVAGSMMFDGRERTYQLFEPPRVAAEQSVPLVLLLHGGGGSGAQMCGLKGTVAEAARAGGALVACPDGVEGHWNDGRRIDDYTAHSEDVDDVGFLLALGAELEQSQHIDPDRIYVSGVSNGGMMALRMACEASDRIAAVAAIIANLPADLECMPSSPMSVLLINGTEDPLMPWAGGEIRFLRRRLGLVLSTNATVGLWVGVDDCSPEATVEALPDSDPDDGTRVRSDRFVGCDRGTEVRLYTVQGGGHALPGGEQYAPRALIGRVSHDLNAGEAVWEFFQSGTR
ncbi:MAG: alpha/beta fold hydrolase [Anaerolineales bacterium]